jgi:hypothetical protein
VDTSVRIETRDDHVEVLGIAAQQAVADGAADDPGPAARVADVVHERQRRPARECVHGARVARTWRSGPRGCTLAP